MSGRGRGPRRPNAAQARRREELEQPPEGGGHRTCYADTHHVGHGYMSLCGQVSNAVAVDDPAAVTCRFCASYFVQEQSS